jgi:hypothetical protein
VTTTNIQILPLVVANGGVGVDEDFDQEEASLEFNAWMNLIRRSLKKALEPEDDEEYLLAA